VLGVLMEKSLAQPEYYPMTVNAIVAACNQKNNRDPAMELDEDTVWRTLEELRVRGLVTRIFPTGSHRTNRFRHEAASHWNWSRNQQAVMAELFLRGPQTLGELKGHASRMVPFENLESVSGVLDSLAALSLPLVAPLPRAPGQSAVRFTHLLYPADERPSGAIPARASSPSAAAGSEVPSSRQPETLRAELEELRREVSELRRRLDAFEAVASGSNR